MNLKDYQLLAARTAPLHLSDAEQRENCAMGLLGELCGEVVDTLKKRKFHGHDIGDKLRDELGDSLWYAATAATIIGVELEAAEFHDFGDPYTACVAVAMFARALAYGGGRADNLSQVVAAIATIVEGEGYALSDVLEHNVAKLERRYPDGFSEKASIERTS